MAIENTPKPEKKVAKRSAAGKSNKKEAKASITKSGKKGTSQKVSSASKTGDAKTAIAKAELTPNIQRLLRVRRLKQRQRPRFRDPECWRYGRVHSHWRFPHGIDNKTIRKWKCGVKTPIVGYRGPRLVRGMHPCGMYEVLVTNLKDADNLDPTKHCIKIAAHLGARKRMIIIEKLQQKQFKILNIGMSEKEFQEFQAMIEEKSAGTEEAKQ